MVRHCTLPCKLGTALAMGISSHRPRHWKRGREIQTSCTAGRSKSVRDRRLGWHNSAALYKQVEYVEHQPDPFLADRESESWQILGSPNDCTSTHHRARGKEVDLSRYKSDVIDLIESATYWQWSYLARLFVAFDGRHPSRLVFDW